jgi:FkbM family methyltransferase
MGAPNKLVVVKLPWNNSIEVNPRETIGRSIWTTGVTDISVCETLCRLLNKGDIAIDVGANIGFMTGVMAACVGPTGHVECFEPNPQVLPLLKRNLARIQQAMGVKVTLRECAVSNRSGETNLCFPADFDSNQGTASIAIESGIATVSNTSVRVPMVRLDDLFDAESDKIAVLKVDVEGHEAEVLRGAERLLRERRIRFLIFEEHGGIQCDSFAILQAMGYQVFRIGWQSNGMVCAPLASEPIHSQHEAANFVATYEPLVLAERLSDRGFRIFSKSYWRKHRS